MAVFYSILNRIGMIALQMVDRHSYGARAASAGTRRVGRHDPMAALSCQRHHARHSQLAHLLHPQPQQRTHLADRAWLCHLRRLRLHRRRHQRASAAALAAPVLACGGAQRAALSAHAFRSAPSCWPGRHRWRRWANSPPRMQRRSLCPRPRSPACSASTSRTGLRPLPRRIAYVASAFPVAALILFYLWRERTPVGAGAGALLECRLLLKLRRSLLRDRSAQCARGAR